MATNQGEKNIAMKPVKFRLKIGLVSYYAYGEGVR